MNKYWVNCLLFICSYSIIIGQDNTTYNTNAAVANTGDKVSFFGKSVGFNNTGNASSAFGGRVSNDTNNSGDSTAYFGYAWSNRNSGDYNSIYGSESGPINTTGAANVFFGHRSGYRNITGNQNTYLGRGAGSDIREGPRNTVIGAKRFEQNPSMGRSNVMVGFEVAYQDTSGRNNTFIGTFSAWKNTTGKFNTFFGAYSGDENRTGNRNTLLGVFSDMEDGNENTIVGFGSTCGHCMDNVIAGSRIHANKLIAYDNVFLGNQAGNNIGGTNNIFIGARSGIPNCNNSNCNEFLFNSLYIDIEKTNSPLILGDFIANRLIINGEFEVATGFDLGSDINLKSDIQSIHSSHIFAKVIQLPIYHWSYKYDPTVEHIGPMAHDFQRIFQLSDNDTSIHMVDMDGIKLAALQELKIEQDKNVATRGKIQVRQSEIKQDIQSLQELISLIEIKIYSE